MKPRGESCDLRADLHIFVSTGIHRAPHEFMLLTAAMYQKNKTKTLVLKPPFKLYWLNNSILI